MVRRGSTKTLKIVTTRAVDRIAGAEGKRKFGIKAISASLGNELEGRTYSEAAFRSVGRRTLSGQQRQYIPMNSTSPGRSLLR